MSSKVFTAKSHRRLNTPANPDTGFDKLYFKNDGKLYKLNSLGVETPIESTFTSAGVKNHLVSGDDITVDANFLYLVYGDLTIDAGATMTNNGKVVIINGNLVEDGIFVNNGDLEIVNLAQEAKTTTLSFTTVGGVPLVLTHGLNTLDFTYNARQGNDDISVQLTRINPNKVSILTPVAVTGSIKFVR